MFLEQSTVEICDACSKGVLDLVKGLITRGTSPWVHDNQGNTLSIALWISRITVSQCHF